MTRVGGMLYNGHGQFFCCQCPGNDARIKRQHPLTASPKQQILRPTNTANVASLDAGVPA